MNPVQVLIADDDDIDIEVLQPVIETYGARVSVARDEQQALHLVDRTAADRQPLALVLLDWKLEGVGRGPAVLTAIRDSSWHQTTPVIVISKSTAPVDVRDACRAGANAFVGKTLELDEYEAKIHAICGFWLTVAEAPMPAIEVAS